MENENYLPDWIKVAMSDQSCKIKIHRDELRSRYFRFGLMYNNISSKHMPDSDGFYTLSAKQILNVERKLQKAIAKEQLLYKCVERNNLGIEYEKQGEVEKAVELYEENIKPGCYPAMHSFDRLLVIYRRTGEYKKELRVCKRAISVFNGIDKYIKRLGKIESIIEKNTKKGV